MMHPYFVDMPLTLSRTLVLTLKMSSFVHKVYDFEIISDSFLRRH
jgi:hypothetical protein